MHVTERQVHAVVDYFGDALKDFASGMFKAEKHHDDQLMRHGTLEARDKQYSEDVDERTELKLATRAVELVQEAARARKLKAERRESMQEFSRRADEAWDTVERLKEQHAAGQAMLKTADLGESGGQKLRLKHRSKHRSRSTQKWGKAIARAKKAVSIAKQKVVQRAKKASSVAMNKTNAVTMATLGGKLFAGCPPPPPGKPEYWTSTKCAKHNPDEAFDPLAEWTAQGIADEFGPGGDRRKTHCFDWHEDMAKCAWYHKLFRALIYGRGHLWPCLATSYLQAQRITGFQKGTSCSGMIVSHLIDKHSAPVNVAERIPEGAKFVEHLKYLSEKIIEPVYNIANEFGDNQCTQEFNSMYLVVDVLHAFGKLVSKVLPAPWKMIGMAVTHVIKFAKGLLDVPKPFLDKLDEMKHKVFYPTGTLWAFMGDVITFMEIFLKVTAKNKVMAKRINTLIKDAHFNPFIENLNVFFEFTAQD